MKKRVNYFWITIPFVGIVALLSLVFSEKFSTTVSKTTEVTFVIFDWLIFVLPLLAIVFVLYFAFSKFGKYRFGGADAKPEFRTFSWMAMLFTAGIGVGIIFFGPLEGIWEYAYSDWATLDYLTESEKANAALGVSTWLWGVPAWAMYAIGGLIVAYFSYRHNQDFTPSAAIEKGLEKKKWARVVAIVSTSIIIIATAISLSSSYAMASQQVATGVEYVSGIRVHGLIILVVISVIVCLVAISPIKKGMKILGDYTVYLSIILMVFVFLFGPTRFFLVMLVENIGNVLTSTVKYSTNLFVFNENRYWSIWFAGSYWIWWVAWTPFVGTFLAKISKGRTAKEFLLASTLVPAGFLIVWFSIFSGFGVLDTVAGTGKIAEVANSANYEGTIYKLMELLPLSNITNVVVVILFSSFVITTAVSGAITLGILTSKDGKNATKSSILIWAIFIPCIAFSAVLSGKIEGIKAIGSWVGFPYLFFLVLSVVGFIRQYRKDKANGEFDKVGE